MASTHEPSTFVISLTAFGADGTLDEQGLRGHLRRMAAAGIGVYLAGSGSGEGYTLSPAEVRRVLEIGADELGGTVPVRAMGVEPRSAAQMIELARVAQDCGMEAVQLYSLDQGHGNRPRPDELERYLRDVLEAVEIPMVISSHQAAGYYVPPTLLGALVAEYGVLGLNITNTDITYLVDVLAAVDGRAEVHVGGPMLATVALALGATGFLSSDGNLAPKLCVRLVEQHLAGELAARDETYRALMELFTITRKLGGISAAKGALVALGQPGGYPRRPRLPVSDEAGRRLADALGDLGIAAGEDLG